MAGDIREVEAKIIGKWIKGTIWKRPRLSIEFFDGTTPKYIDISVTMAQWNKAEIGDIAVITVEQKEDGLWRRI